MQSKCMEHIKEQRPNKQTNEVTQVPDTDVREFIFLFMGKAIRIYIHVYTNTLSCR